MAHILIEIPINGDPDAVRSTVDTGDGIAAFWTDDVDFPGGVGSEFKVGFQDAPLAFDLTIAESNNETIRWSGGEFPPHWQGTEVIWTFTPNADGGTTVRLDHIGWAAEDSLFAFSTYVWADVLRRLKNFIEDGVREPLSSGTDRTQVK